MSEKVENPFECSGYARDDHTFGWVRELDTLAAAFMDQIDREPGVLVER